jgi:hypothetical protein
MRRVIAPFAAVLLMTGTVVLVNPTAAFAYGFSNAILCDTESTPLCLNVNGGNNANVKGYYYTPGNAQDISETVDTFMCNNGLVSETCPFYLGSGLNSSLVGKPIVTLENNAYLMVYYATNDGYLKENISPLSNNIFVQDGNITNGSSATLVNVGYTNYQHNGDPWAIATAGYGADVQIVDTVNFSSPAADHFTKQAP